MSSLLESRLSTLEFLWSSASKLRSIFQRNRDLEVIQNQLREKCLNLTKGGNGGVNCSSAFQKSAICQYCGTPWSEGCFKLRISPHNYKMKKIRMKLISKEGSLTKYNKHLLGLFNRRKDNVLEKQCLMCKKITKLGLTKPLLPKNEAVADSMQASEDSFQELKKKKKKRSKKDRFSGLTPSAVMSARASKSFRDSLADLEGNEISQFSISNSILSETPDQNNSNVINELEPNLVLCLEESTQGSQANDTACSLETKNHVQKDNSYRTNSFGDLNDCSLVSNISHELNSTKINTKKKRSKNKKKRKMKLSSSDSFLSFNDSSFRSTVSIQESDAPQKNIIKFPPLLHVDSKTLKGTAKYLPPGNKRSASLQPTGNLKGKHKKKRKKSLMSHF